MFRYRGWSGKDASFKWFSEIADYQSRLLKERYPHIPNIGDMNTLPELISSHEIDAPDIICGGTPCQAFSVAGYLNGLNDDRGNLTLKFVDIIDANDEIRSKVGKEPTIVFWENVEGVLSDKTNAFGCLISSLAGLGEDLKVDRWASAGLLRGPKRNVAWRVLDAKYFGLPQQRKRLYLLAGGKGFHPEHILFDKLTHPITRKYPSQSMRFQKDGHSFEVFREYTDCLYSAYGTKWNGNAAAYNGSLFVVQDGRLRRFSPVECERLMGFPDNYTLMPKGKKTARYNSIGNSWVVPVVEWIFDRLIRNLLDGSFSDWALDDSFGSNAGLFRLQDEVVLSNCRINCSEVPDSPSFSSLEDIVSPDAPEDIFISPVGCGGILRRKTERNMKMNSRLEFFLTEISSMMDPEEIERISLIQPRGEFSKSLAMAASTKSVLDVESSQGSMDGSVDATTVTSRKSVIQTTFDSF